jgi:hypothetical protein
MSSINDSLMRCRVFVELGRIPEAELEVARILERDTDNLDALSLFAKIKHVKGELSHAIACWGRLQTCSQRMLSDAFGGTASIGHATATEAAPALRELEPALELLRQNRAAEARAWCVALADRSRGQDPILYKLGVIAGSWLAEVCGDLVGARAELERLGAERGYEHDFDRLLALVRVYDRLGTPDAIEAAAKICRHLLAKLDEKRVEKLSVLGQLAALERRAGRREIAEQLDARFREAFRRRMHRASLLDLVRVAAGEYIPLEELRAVEPGDRQLSELSARERAIAAAIRGDIAFARRYFRSSEDRIDRCYLADLAALEGAYDHAIDIYLDTLRAHPIEPVVVGWLLDRHARVPSPAIARHWSDTERCQRTLQLLEIGCELAPQRPAVWRRLATLHEIAGRDATRCAARASALATSRETPIGRVLAAGVYHYGVKAKGLLHEIWASRTPAAPGRGGTLSVDDIHGNVTAELRAAIRNTFVCAREYARAKLPDLTTDLDDYTYAYKVPKEDEQSGGLSAGLPSALAFLSVFLQRPITKTIASSGAIICEAHDVITIGPIGEAEHKVKAAYHGNLRRLILPLANRADVERSTLVPPAICEEIVSYASDLDQAVKIVFGTDLFTRA